MRSQKRQRTSLRPRLTPWMIPHFKDMTALQSKILYLLSYKREHYDIARILGISYVQFKMEYQAALDEMIRVVDPSLRLLEHMMKRKHVRQLIEEYWQKLMDDPMF